MSLLSLGLDGTFRRLFLLKSNGFRITQLDSLFFLNIKKTNNAVPATANTQTPTTISTGIGENGDLVISILMSTLYLSS